jgi:hypothetical protein
MCVFIACDISIFFGILSIWWKLKNKLIFIVHLKAIPFTQDNVLLLKYL